MALVHSDVHVLSKFPFSESFRENLILSSSMLYNTFLIHLLWVGGHACLHLRSARRLARKEVKDVI